MVMYVKRIFEAMFKQKEMDSALLPPVIAKYGPYQSGSEIFQTTLNSSPCRIPTVTLTERNCMTPKLLIEAKVKKNQISMYTFDSEKGRYQMP
jgi:hypothetical protein